MDNRQIADRLEAFASLFELAEANPYTARAYRRAAETIRATPAPVAELVRAGRVRELRGIGSGIEARLRELVETGEIAELRRARGRARRPRSSASAATSGSAPSARSRSRGRSASGRPTSCARRPPPGACGACPGIGPKSEPQLLDALARESEPRRRAGCC